MEGLCVGAKGITHANNLDRRDANGVLQMLKVKSQKLANGDGCSYRCVSDMLLGVADDYEKFSVVFVS